MAQTRRKLASSAALFAAIGSIGAFATTSQEVTPDADLIATCAKYLRIQRAFDAMVADGDVENDDPRLSIVDPLPALVERIVNLKATTAEGHVARARCMAFSYLPKHSIAQDDPDGAMEVRFQAALYRDLIAQERPEALAGSASA